MAGLTGMKEICIYLRRSEATILGWIRAEGLPATKLGGQWESDSSLIDQWRIDRISDGSNHGRKRVSTAKTNK